MTAYTFDQLITFTRTSAATYVGSNGLVAVTPASRNLLTYTQDFDNAVWGKFVGASVTANTTTAPDGTATADTLTLASTANSRIEQTATVSSGQTYTFSVWMRVESGTLSVRLYGIDAGVGSAFTVNTSWQRFNITQVASSGTRFPAIVTGGTAGNVFIWGAQLEQASSATTYTRNNGGVYPPRFDYDPVTRAPRGLLIEEQRTNLLLRSEEFDNASWVKENAGVGSVPTVTPNAGVAPDGNTTADRVQFALNGGTTTTDRSTLRQLVTATAAAHTFSFWVRSFDGVSTYQIQVRDQLGTGAPLTVTGAWQRVTLTNTYTAGPASIGLDLRGGQTPANSNVADILIWGAQLEAGAFATSYIPTVASQVTRTADVAAITAPMFAPWYNQSEGTFVVQWDGFKPTTASGVPHIFQVGNGSNSFIDTVLSGPNYLARVTTGGVDQSAISTAYAANSVEKIASAYKLNDFAFSRNGAAVLMDTSGTPPTGIDRMGVGVSQSGTFALNGHIQSIDYYPTRLTNAQIQALTA